MGEYYDKNKFTGGRPSGEQHRTYGGRAGGSTPPPSRPYRQPPGNQDNSGWYSWPVIIILFALGIWPIALALLQHLWGQPEAEEFFQPEDHL